MRKSGLPGVNDLELYKHELYLELLGMAAFPAQALAEESQRDLGEAGKRGLRLGAPGVQHLARACAREVQDG